MVDTVALWDQLRALLSQAEALDYNDNQPRDPDGKFGSGGGGDKTGEMTPVGGGGHGGGGGGDATREMTPAGSEGHGHNKPNATTRPNPKTDHAADKARKDAEDKADHDRLKQTSKDVAKSTGKKADQWSGRAASDGTHESHERAASGHRIASGAHRIAGQLHPEHAAQHEAAANKHDKAAEHHEREMIKRQPKAANVMHIEPTTRINVASTPLAASANGGSVPETGRMSVDAMQLDAKVFSGKAPSEFRIFPKGEAPSYKGVFLFDDIAAKSVMDTYKMQGRACSFDYDHGSLMKQSPNPSQTAKGAGLFELEMRDGELWAVNCTFTAEAKRGIEAGEWLWFSPAFSKLLDKDGKETPRPAWLINCALSNNPALFNLDILAEQATALHAAMLSAPPATNPIVAVVVASAPVANEVPVPTTPSTPTVAPAGQPAAPPATAAPPTAATTTNATTALLSALAAPVMLGWSGNMVVDGCDYDWRRSNAMASAEAVLADASVQVGPPPAHPAATSPLTGRFADPLTNGNGRWVGWIEPIRGEWICFVGIDGKSVLYTQRADGNGSVREGSGLGVPVVFTRTLETLSVAADACTVDYACARDVTRLSAVPYRGYPEPKDDPTSWDAEAALHRLRQWASSDGTGDTSAIDWSKYGEGFAYVADPPQGQQHTLADFKLPHHDVRHGELVTIRKAVYQAAGRISAAGIPEEDIPAVQQHLEQHYHQWGAKAPWENPDQGKATNMHAKLSDYASKMGLDKGQLKLRMLAATPGFMKQTALDAMAEDASKHPDDKEMAKILKALKALDAMEEEAPESESEKAKALAALTALNAGNVPSVVALGAALGLNPNAPEADVIKGVANTLHGISQLSALTGESTIQGSIATVRAWKTSAEEGKVATAQLNAITAENVKREALSALDRTVTEKGLSPAQKAEALSIYDKDGAVGLNAYLKGASGNAAITPPAGTPPSGFTPANAEQIAALNAAGHLPGAPKPGDKPTSETPQSGAPAAPAKLSARADRFVRRSFGLDDAAIGKLSVGDITTYNAMDLD